MKYLLSALIGYLIGTVNPSFLFAKRKGFDIRDKGSGNAGASNAVILFGKGKGTVCALLDIGKACLAIGLTRRLLPGFLHALPVTGAACVLGHIFPFQLKFRGGKGLACLGGMILMFSWRLFLTAFALEVLLALLVDYICVVPITASAAFPIVYGMATGDLPGVLILSVVTCVMLYKHMENLRRIQAGTEMRLSYLWKPEQELERLRNNAGETMDAVLEHLSKDSSPQS